MRDASDFVARQPELCAPPPIAPWDYIRMRREAAGLTIARAALLFVHRDDQQLTVEASLRTFETPNVVVKRVADLDLPRAFPFRADVYEQLVDPDPSRHPRLCRCCGWDAWTEQNDLDGNSVRFSDDRPDLCTRCEQIDERGVRRAA